MQLYRLSRHPVQEFPLAIVSLNVTKWTLVALRSGGLHRAANARGSVLEAANDFFAGGMATFYTTWLSQGATMADSGHVLKALEVRMGGGWVGRWVGRWMGRRAGSQEGEELVRSRGVD